MIPRSRRGNTVHVLNERSHNRSTTPKGRPDNWLPFFLQQHDKEHLAPTAHRFHTINRLIIGLVDQRNLILEGSEYYKANMAVLTARLAARTITPELAKNIQPSIQMSALSLIGVS